MSRQSTPPPPPGDVDTPNVSILGDTYMWDENQKQLIEAHRQYHYDMACFLYELDREGPVGKVLPKKPYPDIKTLLTDHIKKKPNLLSGRDLHEYLMDKQLAVAGATCPTVAEVPFITNLESIVINLKSGYEILKKHNSVSLSNSLYFGEWLDVAFDLHAAEKEAGKVSSTWKYWLEKNVGIQDSYARKLREMSKLLTKYPRFGTLGIPFSEIYQRRKQIQGMVTSDRDIAQYWQQA